MKAFFLFLFSIFAITTLHAQTFIAEGLWRGVFHQSNGADIPFNFEVKGKNAGTAKLYLINATEHFPASSLTQKGDSLYVAFDQFDNELALKITDKELSGVLRKKDRSGRLLPISAKWGEIYRFADDGKKPDADISGKYEVTFQSPKGGEDIKKVGLFRQEGSKLYATFLSISGDSRYLEGIVQGDKFYLSSFIGSGPGYYTGTFNNGRLTGTAGGATFTAIKNPDAALPDPYKLTYLKEGYQSFDFSLPDADGNKVSLKDDKFKNKVVILTIGGTWCPNCMDEASFVAPWYKKNKNRGVEVVGVQFERKSDQSYVKNAMENFKRRFDIGYTEVFGGLADKKAVAESFPALNTFLSFPTILFIDKNGKVDKIYTGFTGPATGEYYTQFIKEFNDEVDKLLKEKV